MVLETNTLLKTSDNHKIALWKIWDDTQKSKETILCIHGTFSNKSIFKGLAKFLTEKGYVLYIMEWRNHGKSSGTNLKYNFETIGLIDIKTIFEYLFEAQVNEFIHCITHSGGGICLTMFLAANSQYVNRVRSISMFACQAFGATNYPLNGFRIFISKYLTALLGYIPSKLLGLGPHDESYYTMKQWFDWNLKRNFKSSINDLDYRNEMNKISSLIYSISGGGDNFIAPSHGCKLFLETFENPQNVFKEFSLSNGDLEDYDHSRIILSRNAAAEIWPSVLNWIEKN